MRQKALLQCEGVNQDMERKTALVTGSAKGIGRSIALKLAEKGYDIIVNAKSVRPDFNGETAYDVQRLVEETGRKAYSCIADISSHEGRQKILDCVDEIGRVDILVNNAGIEPPGKDVLEVTGEELELVLGTNFYGPFALTQQIAKRMIAWKSSGVIEQARIAFITSIQADRVSSGVGYCISKVAIRNVVQQLAIRLGEADIPVVEFTPGVFLTSMSHNHVENITNKLETGDWALNRRWGEIDEIGNIVASLADGVFDYSTGSAIPVSGGMNVFRL